MQNQGTCTHFVAPVGLLELDLNMNLHLDLAAADDSLIGGFRRFWVELRAALDGSLTLGRNCEGKLLGVAFPRYKPLPDRIGWDTALAYVIEQR